MRLIALLATAVALAGCRAQTPAAPEPKTYTDAAHGISVSLPRGWQRATTSLTPGLTDPREVLAVATFPLRYRETQCGHMPASALEDIGAHDAFVTLQERGRDPGSSWLDFPPRPRQFGLELGSSSEASACVPGAHFTDHWFGFSDGDRHFHVLVAFGSDASPAVQREAWQILDDVQIDPEVRPDWRSVG